MPSFDEAKSPLTLANIQAWAHSEFPDAFDALPRLDKVAFIDVDVTTFDRTVRRSLGRSLHKKLLIVGLYSPGADIEGSVVCAHIHAGEDEVSFYRVHELEDETLELDDETLELRPVTSPGHIAFHPPFSEVGNDIGRVLAVVRFYFLAANYLKELIRHKKAPKSFTKMFEEACRWILNGGERPPTGNMASVFQSESMHGLPMANDNPKNPAVNPSILRSATRQNQASPVKRERESTNLEDTRTPKHRAFTVMSSDAVHPAPKPIMFANIAAQSEIAERKAQITVLLAVNAKLKQDMAMQGHAYRGLQLVLDETKEDLADMEARMNAEQAHCVHLRAEMGKIKELVNKCGV